MNTRLHKFSPHPSGILAVADEAFLPSASFGNLHGPACKLSQCSLSASPCACKRILCKCILLQAHPVHPHAGSCTLAPSQCIRLQAPS
eukprot:1161659-Pelagomonas_calceolata.AAC.1